MRIVLWAAAIVGLALQHAWSQAGGVPPGLPLPECQQLQTFRDTVQLHGQAIEAANRRKVSALAGCRLFQAYLAAELKLMSAIHASGARCGVPPGVGLQIKASHARASAIGMDVCKAAGVPLDENKPRGPGDFWTRDELDRHFGRGTFERGR